MSRHSYKFMQYSETLGAFFMMHIKFNCKTFKRMQFQMDWINRKTKSLWFVLMCCLQLGFAFIILLYGDTFLLDDVPFSSKHLSEAFAVVIIILFKICIMIFFSLFFSINLIEISCKNRQPNLNRNKKSNF